jgi:hypothetical protein
MWRKPLWEFRDRDGDGIHELVCSYAFLSAELLVNGFSMKTRRRI